MSRNPGLPPPHVREALRKFSYLEEHPDHPVVEPCCQPWETAHFVGSDCESIAWLVAYNIPWPPGSPPDTSTGKPVIGSDLPPVRYCPWCGHSKTKKRKHMRRA
ncbi:MAG: hypothetical protein WAO08_38675 [Hyphomicrobiaceae bacterium]